MDILTIIIAVVALAIGFACGYFVFLKVIKGKYNEMVESANKEAEVIKEKKLGRRKNDLDNQQQRIDNEKKALALKQDELGKMQQKEREKLEELSGLSADEARSRLVESLKDEEGFEVNRRAIDIFEDALRSNS